MKSLILSQIFRFCRLKAFIQAQSVCQTDTVSVGMVLPFHQPHYDYIECRFPIEKRTSLLRRSLNDRSENDSLRTFQPRLFLAMRASMRLPYRIV